MKIIVTVILLTILFSIFFSGCIKNEELFKELSNISEQGISKKYDKEGNKDIDESYKYNYLYQKLMADSKIVADISRRDLSHNLNIPENEIIIDTIVPVEWSDTSFGYPEDGKQYSINFTEGYVILLLAKEKLYEYHTDRGYKVIPPPNYLPVDNSH